MTTYAPQEAAARSGFSLDTLRYYERIGLLDDVDRTSAGRRVYTEEHLDWLGILSCRYCTPACKTEAWRRDHAGDTERQPVPRNTPAPPPPATLRDRPHCGQPVAIVTLLAAPHVAQVDTPHNIR
jgi:hypothetical protein